jgi:ParB family chromosome partitioning protein
MVFKSTHLQNPTEVTRIYNLTEPHTVKLSNVNLKDPTFRITTRTDVEDLIDSIRHLGLLHPPVLKKNSLGYIIISGFRRIAACRDLGWTEIPAKILDSSLDMLKCAKFAIAENAFQRPLNLIETSRALKLLADLIQDRKFLVESASGLGLPLSSGVVDKLEQLCQLPWSIQEGILADTISMPIALELGGFESDVGHSMVKLFNHLKVGLNKQRELILFLKEIAMREDTDIKNVLEERKIREILANSDLDRPQKSQKIRTYLRQRRFPSIVEAEENFAKLTKQLELGKEIKLTPPKDFEGTTYTLTLRFSSLNDLRKLKARLDRIIRNPILVKIFRSKSLSD